MAAKIRFIDRPRGRLDRDEAARLRERLVDLRDDESERPTLRLMVRRLLNEVDRQAASESKWRFVMISAEDHYAVCCYLQEHSRRPALAQRLWAYILANMSFETGEVLRSREQLAAELKVSGQVVSVLMGELVKVGAISRCYEDEETGTRVRAVRYFVNPRIATNERGVARDEVQRQAAPLLKLIDGAAHPSQRRSRAPRAVVSEL